MQHALLEDLGPQGVHLRLQLHADLAPFSRKSEERARSNEQLDTAVLKLHAANKSSYGRPHILQSLRKQGHQMGHERVRRSLLRQGLRPLYKRPYRVTKDSNHRKPIADNVLDRRFDGWAPNRAGVGDITCIATDEGWPYLAW